EAWLSARPARRLEPRSGPWGRSDRPASSPAPPAPDGFRGRARWRRPGRRAAGPRAPPPVPDSRRRRPTGTGRRRVRSSGFGFSGGQDADGGGGEGRFSLVAEGVGAAGVPGGDARNLAAVGAIGVAPGDVGDIG